MQSNKLSGYPVISQLLSYIPKELVSQATLKYDADRYYKTMTTYKQLVFMFYGIVVKAQSLNSLCKSLLFLDGKLAQLGIKELPASSTLSDANALRPGVVFKELYSLLLAHYQKELIGSYFNLAINGEAPGGKVMRFDSTTFSLFVDVLKGAGRNPINGKKKGGMKAHCLLPVNSRFPTMVHLTEAARNDRTFPGQLKMEPGNIYVFDKGYVNYKLYAEWTESGAYFVTRMKDNAIYKVTGQCSTVDFEDGFDYGGVIKDESVDIEYGASNELVTLRLVTYKDPLTKKILRFISNQFSYEPETIAQLYQCR